MNTYKKTAVIVGLLFIIGTVSGILSGVVTAPIRAGSTFPLNVSASGTQWIIGTLLILLMGFPLAMVPVVLYPIFRKHNEVLAFGAVLFRGILEAVLYTASVISMLLLLNVSEIFGRTGVTDASNLQTLGTMLTASGDWIFQILSSCLQRRHADDLRPVLSNQAHSSVVVRLGSYWRNVVLLCQLCKHVWSAASSSRYRFGNRALNDPTRHTRNGLCGVVDREGI